MALDQQLTLRQQQRLTQQQLQQIKLLEIPALEMEERVLQEIDDNPALEFGEDPMASSGEDNFDFEDNFDSKDRESSENREEDDFSDLQSYIDDYDDRAADYGETQPVDRDQDNRREPFMGVQTDSLQEYLKRQLADLETNDLERLMGEYIIGNIDDDGYLRATLDTISDQICFQTNEEVSVHQLEHMLEHIREFEPAGVAAKDLQDCLLLQLERKNQTLEVKRATKLLEDYFDDFSEHRYARIIQKWGINEDDFNRAVKEVSRLNPKPGNDWEASLLNETGRQIMPDFVLENNNGRLNLLLNDTTVPDLHVSPTYIRLLKDYQNRSKKAQNRQMREAAAFAKQKIEAARWFIDALEQRQRTLLTTMQAIVDHQEAFFHSGEEKLMRPMKLKDIAAVTGLDISTISRVSNSKFIQTEFGVFPLKHFFSEGLQTADGQEVSVREVTGILSELIEAEDKKHPLTDEALVRILNEKGYRLARRTVAKYREQLGIASSRQRTIE